MHSIGEISDKPSRSDFGGEGQSFFQTAAAAVRLLVERRMRRRREFKATIEKYQLLAQEFRNRAQLPNLAGQRQEMLAFALHFERCTMEIRRADQMLLH